MVATTTYLVSDSHDPSFTVIADDITVHGIRFLHWALQNRFGDFLGGWIFSGGGDMTEWMELIV